MEFSENLQTLRKMKNMSQEQLAEKLDVSRQAVSKWESGSGYPETEKLIAICEIFNCSIDEILKGKFSENANGDKKEYENLMNRFSKGIALAVVLILIGVTIFMYIVGIPGTEEMKEKYGILGTAVVLLFVLIAVPIFIVLGIEQENYKKRNSKLPNMYTEEEIEKFNPKFAIAIAVAVMINILSAIQLIVLYGMEIVNEESTIPTVIFLGMTAISVYIYIYYGIQKSKYDIELYNKTSKKISKHENDIVGKISGVIMIIATMIFFICGIVYNLWHIAWIVFPIGGMLCGIVAIIFEKEEIG